jgi:tRNA-dihydrouridine synthase
MLGRAIFGNPWLFHPEKELDTVSLKERLSALVEHTTLFETLLPHKNFALMKKHYKAYVSGFSGAAELRGNLMEQSTASEVEAVVHAFLDSRGSNTLH